MLKELLYRDSQVFLSTVDAKPRDRKLALIVVILSVAVFVMIAPYAKTPLPKAMAFIPAYQSALAICDFITTVLLIGQFQSFRSRSLIVLACGYLFTGLTALVHMFTFPGVFELSDFFEVGPQSTAWLYMIWHGGFPLFVIAYALIKRNERADAGSEKQSVVPVVAGVTAVVAMVAAFTLLVTRGSALLPALMLQDNHYTAVMVQVVSSVWVMSLAALLILWRCNSKSVLDLWLMVVIFAWLVDIALSAVLNSGRFDLGFYAGRFYGLMAASFILLVLLVESGMMYARLIEMTEVLQQMSSTDALTKIANRRVFDENIDKEWRRALRNRSSLSVLMIDVDFFKMFNDTYGHLAGDKCLHMVAQALAAATRRSGDLVARYGGEEFVALLPQTDLIHAGEIAQRMLQSVAELKIPHEKSAVSPCVTVSIGVGNTSPDWVEQDAERAPAYADERSGLMALLKTADEALYMAKVLGRNQVSVGNA